MGRNTLVMKTPVRSPKKCKLDRVWNLEKYDNWVSIFESRGLPYWLYLFKRQMIGLAGLGYLVGWFAKDFSSMLVIIWIWKCSNISRKLSDLIVFWYFLVIDHHSCASQVSLCMGYKWVLRGWFTYHWIYDHPKYA